MIKVVMCLTNSPSLAKFNQKYWYRTLPHSNRGKNNMVTDVFVLLESYRGKRKKSIPYTH